MDREMVKLINGAASVAIFPHVSADGDAIGSSLALGMALRNLGKKVEIYMEEDIPGVYKFLPGMELTRIPGPSEEIADMSIALDTGDVGRLAARAALFFKAPCTVNIDHHITNTEFAHYNHVDALSASTGEIVFELLKELKADIDEAIAACLYTAIATDTGGFKYGNTTAETHRIAAVLLKVGIDIAELSQKIFDNSTYEKLRLTQKAIELLQLHENSKLAVTLLSQEDFRATGAKDEDCDGLVNIGRSIESVEVSVLLKEKEDGEIRANLRSKSFVDVSEIAAAFSGGGHKRAAGCTLKGVSLQEAAEQMIKAVKDKL